MHRSFAGIWSCYPAYIKSKLGLNFVDSLVLLLRLEYIVSFFSIYCFFDEILDVL